VRLFRPSLGFLAEAQPRLKTGEDKKHFLAEVHIKFARTTKQKTSLKKLQIYFVSAFFKEINLLTDINNFFCICY
jgi:hypothetical protein